VNAALQDLHNQGLVTKVLNRSTNVSRYELEDIERLFAVRVLLEPGAAAALAAAWGAEAESRLRERVEAMRGAARSRDLAGFCMADYEFHQEIYRLTGNPFLIHAAEAIAAAPFAYVLCGRLEALPTDYAALAEDHQAIVAALAQGADEAARMTRGRIQAWLEHSRRMLAADRVSEGTTVCETASGTTE
jgi:DNA-binding GntR family transcriptional regulator